VNGSRVRGRAERMLFVAFGAAGCTTDETGSIELTASSAKASPKPPKMPMPMPTPMPTTSTPMPTTPMPCAVDMDCPKPMPHCDPSTLSCMECLTGADCMKDPMHRFCDGTTARCVACTADAGCAPGEHCEMDSTCHPMP